MLSRKEAREVREALLSFVDQEMKLNLLQLLRFRAALPLRSQILADVAAEFKKAEARRPASQRLEADGDPLIIRILNWLVENKEAVKAFIEWIMELIMLIAANEEEQSLIDPLGLAA